jgi:hypothetical protein
MAEITLKNLQSSNSTGSFLFDDPESFMTEIIDSDAQIVGGYAVTAYSKLAEILCSRFTNDLCSDYSRSFAHPPALTVFTKNA